VYNISYSDCIEEQINRSQKHVQPWKYRHKQPYKERSATNRYPVDIITRIRYNRRKTQLLIERRGDEMLAGRQIRLYPTPEQKARLRGVRQKRSPCRTTGSIFTETKVFRFRGRVKSGTERRRSYRKGLDKGKFYNPRVSYAAKGKMCGTVKDCDANASENLEKLAMLA